MKREKKMRIFSNLINFLNIDNSRAQQICKENHVPTGLEKEENEDIFNYIYGHDKLKLIFNNAIASNEAIHILLTGASGTSKTLFLEAINENVDNCSFITSNSTGAGILYTLYSNPNIEYLLIDELEKIPKDELAVLLTLMESGKLIVTKKTMMCNRQQNVKIFATCNKVEKLSPEMRSRFLKFYLKDYSLEEFNRIPINIVTDRSNKTEEFAQKLAQAVWYQLNSKDIRDVIKVARLARNESDIDMIIEAIQEYGKDEE
jgi:holliday junction DNA helicase RuvB